MTASCTDWLNNKHIAMVNIKTILMDAAITVINNDIMDMVLMTVQFKKNT